MKWVAAQGEWGASIAKAAVAKHQPAGGAPPSPPFSPAAPPQLALPKEPALTACAKDADEKKKEGGGDEAMDQDLAGEGAPMVSLEGASRQEQKKKDNKSAEEKDETKKKKKTKAGKKNTKDKKKNKKHEEKERTRQLLRQWDKKAWKEAIEQAKAIDGCNKAIAEKYYVLASGHPLSDAHAAKASLHVFKGDKAETKGKKRKGGKDGEEDTVCKDDKEEMEPVAAPAASSGAAAIGGVAVGGAASSSGGALVGGGAHRGRPSKFTREQQLWIASECFKEYGSWSKDSQTPGKFIKAVWERGIKGGELPPDCGFQSVRWAARVTPPPQLAEAAAQTTVFD